MAVPRLPGLPALPKLTANLANPGFDYGSTNYGFGSYDPSAYDFGGGSGGFFPGSDPGGAFPGGPGGQDCGPFGLFCDPRGISIGGPSQPGGTGGSGSPGSSGGGTSIPGRVAGAVTGAISSVLGIPAINWGRIAAFLLGLLLIGGGLYLIKPVQEVINEQARAFGEGVAA